MLPGTIRASYCNLLNLWIDRYLSITQTGVKYTWSWDEISNNYSAFESRKAKTEGSLSWLVKNDQKLKEFIFDFLREKDFESDKEKLFLLYAVSNCFIF